MDGQQIDLSAPKAFILAADHRYTPYHPENDQVWELGLNQRTSQPIYLHTTYNLRARSMDLFPWFSIDNARCWNLQSFFSPPAVTDYIPDYIRIMCEPQRGIEISFDCFIPEPDTLVGEIETINRDDHAHNLSIELGSVLVPMGKGLPTRSDKFGINQFLSGKTDDLHPVLYMSGGPTATNNPHPALSLSTRLGPGESQRLTWTLVTKDTREASLDAARQMMSTSWRETVQAHQMAHASQTIQIHTGEPAWDTAFYISQVQTSTHLIANPVGNGGTFLETRLPDLPVHKIEALDGRDNLTLLEAVHLSQALGPGQMDWMKAVLDNFFSRIDDTGRLPSRRHFSESGRPIQECPLLAHLCLSIIDITGDLESLKSTYPKLQKYWQSWMDQSQPENDDSSPILESAAQLQLDNGLFNFDVWEAGGCGLDIRSVESPALNAMLYREAACLNRIAEILEDRSSRKIFKQQMETLLHRVQALWNEEQGIFCYRDAQSRLHPPQELQISGNVRPNLKINQRFNHPQRLVLHLFSSDENTRVCKLRFKGKSPEGKPVEERYQPLDIRWVMGRAHLTTKNLYKPIQSLAIEGLNPEDRYRLETADLSAKDLSCLLPVWSGAVSPGQMEAILTTHICLDDPTLKCGLPEICPDTLAQHKNQPTRMNVLWNTLILQGLTRAGYHNEAAQLFTRMMGAIWQGLQGYQGFFPHYDSQNGRPSGTRNSLAGLVPLGLFLELGGIRLYNPNKVAVWGENPFPWPLEVHWQGLSIHKEAANVRITFADGSMFQGDVRSPLLLTPAKTEDYEQALD